MGDHVGIPSVVCFALPPAETRWARCRKDVYRFPLAIVLQRNGREGHVCRRRRDRGKDVGTEFEGPHQTRVFVTAGTGQMERSVFCVFLTC